MLLLASTVFFKDSFRNTIRESNGLDADQDWSGSKLFANVISRQQVTSSKEIAKSQPSDSEFRQICQSTHLQKNLKSLYPDQLFFVTSCITLVSWYKVLRVQ